MSVDHSIDASPGSRPTIEFDHHSPAYRASSREILDTNLAKCPVAWSSAYGGFWVVSDHASLSQVIRDDDTFTSTRNLEDPSDPRQGIVIPPSTAYQIPMEFDPPLYTEYRRMLNPYFSPTASRETEPFARQAVDALLDRVCATGRMDFILDFGNPMPAMTTMELIGLPLDDWQSYAEPMHRVAAMPPTDPDYQANVDRMQQLAGLVMRLIPPLRTEDAPGMLSGLAKAKINDEPLSDEEIANISLLVIQGGVHTTTALFAHTMLWLEDHPEQRRQLLDDPKVMEHATDEFLRMFTPIQALARTVTKDVVVGDQQMHTGERVLMCFAAANRDPAVFGDPDEVRLDRAPNRHTSFGLGIHRCIGMHLARAWFQVMVRRVLERMPDYRIDREGTVRTENVGVVNGFVTMPVTFTPSEPLGVPMPG